VVALCGGVGGAKLALGLSHAIAPEALSVVVNTGDDFEHLGLHISPDIDTVLYTLAGLNDTERGWGRADETWSFMDALRQLGAETWFQLGDRDLALHVERTRRLREAPLSAVTVELASRLGIAVRILPMTDAPLRTIIETDAGLLPFQRYFVEQRCAPKVRAIHFDGAASAQAAPGVIEALAAPNLRAIIICPSNPYLSIDPILAVRGIRDAIERASAPVIAVSPIIGGQAVKGPAAKIMRELGIEPSAQAIAAHYAGLIDALVIDQADSDTAARLTLPSLVTQTMMRTLSDRTRLAREVLDFAATLARRSEPMLRAVAR
jgi:LPPG:FO 2-phospho-L-lactate transferase